MTLSAPILSARHAGSKFRPVHWCDISKPNAPVIGWGIEEKPAGARRYIPRGYGGEVHPFASKAEAQKVCDDLNAQAAAIAKSQEGSGEA